MENKKQKFITLIGVGQAREGYTFLHQGSSHSCEGCQYYRVCIENIQVGRIYEVTGVREKVFPCDLHEKGVRVVEVSEANIVATQPAKLAINGVVITFQAQTCDALSCENFEECVPRGLVMGDRCVITEIGKKVNCPEGLNLVKVILHRLPGS